MSKILVFAGAKQSGKTSAARFIAAYYLQNRGQLGTFNIDHDGKIWIPIDINGKIEDGELDLTRTDFEFAQYASQHFWPYVQIYSFASALKETVQYIFGIDMKLMCGTHEQKQSKTNIRWIDMSKLLHPTATKALRSSGKISEYMTIREVLQYFGTNICRTLQDDCWINACLKRIELDQPELAIIDDCRFVNEITACKKKDGKTIKLTRIIEEDSHDSEQNINKVSKQTFTTIIDNQELSLIEKNDKLKDILTQWGWVQGKLQ